jgi:hypothetical protein
MLSKFAKNQAEKRDWGKGEEAAEKDLYVDSRITKRCIPSSY